MESSKQHYLLRTSIPDYGMRNVELNLSPLDLNTLFAKLTAKIGSDEHSYDLEGKLNPEKNESVIRLLMYRHNTPKAAHILILKKLNLGPDLSGDYDGQLIHILPAYQKPKKKDIFSVDDLVEMERNALLYDTQPAYFTGELKKVD